MQAQVVESDSLALVALYNSTNGPNWNDKTNWLSQRPVGEWHGITVENGRVLLLLLGKNGLSGVLPEQLGDLDGLVDLSLSKNKITGPIPGTIGNLTLLAYLHLHENELSGSIPAQMGGLQSVRYIYLNDNLLTGPIPPQLGTLGQLSGLK